METEDTKFKVGDRCKIVNYGHLIWSHKEVWKEAYKAGFTTKDKPDNIIAEDENIWYHDIGTELLGKEVIIIKAHKTQGIDEYATNVVSWLNNEQLELCQN
jgi:hypothetical protein